MNFPAFTLAFVLWMCAAGVDARAQSASSLSDFPFWQKMAGWWESDNTYMDADIDYLVRSYNSLVHVELDGKQYRETEHRIYPAGLGATQYGKDIAKPGEGIELVVITTGELIDDKGTLGNIRVDHTFMSSGPGIAYHVLSNNDAVRINTNSETGVDTYRYYINIVTPDRRYRSNFGLISDGEQNVGGLRAFILYRDRRIDAAVFDARRKALREKNAVAVTSVADPHNPGRSLVTRLK